MDEEEQDPLINRSRVNTAETDIETQRLHNAIIAVLAVMFVAAVAVIAVLASKDSMDPGQESARSVQDKLFEDIRTSINDDVDPCQDFYQYACGGWLHTTSIPPDKNTWSRSFSVIHERSLTQLRTILEDGDKTVEGKFYQACMDEARINERGTEPMASILQQLEDLTTSDKALNMSAGLMRLGVSSLMSIGVEVDSKDPTVYILGIGQGGLGLPDRDYYIDESHASLRDKYVAHVAKVLNISGITEDSAMASAREILDFETKLAGVSLKREEMRDPDLLYNKKTLEVIKTEISPSLDWVLYFTTALSPEIDVSNDLEVNVATPKFFSNLGDILNGTSVETLKSYFRFHAMHSYSGSLHEAMRNATFEFYAHQLSGQEQQPPRWKKCVSMTDSALGDALGKTYVEQHFTSSDKKRAQDLIRSVEDAFEHRLVNVRWMDNKTRDATVKKLQKISNNVGYPDKWIDYDFEVIDDLFENEYESRKFENHRELEKLQKKKVDRDEWEMTAPTVNAYYDPSKNKMVFPAGILQYPFFQRTAPAAINFGAIGAVMGHELTHAFDDEGRKFNGDGKLEDWWEPEAITAFVNESKCVENQFSDFPVPGADDGSKINGKLTLGENIADLGGVKSAFYAFQMHKKTRSLVETTLDQPHMLKFLTEDKLFFVSYAQAWCEHVRKEYSQLLAKTDPHSPPEYRVLGPLANLPEFISAFGCEKEIKTFVRPEEKQCRVW